MAGIYIHIPFCRSKCSYCNFYSTVSSRYVDDFIPALINEIRLQKDYLNNEKIETIYIGGGTPSVLNEKQLMNIFDELFKTFIIATHPEITIEVNPNDINKNKINEFQKTPINRISIGIQSFFEEDLKYLKRIHTVSQAEYAVKYCQDAGYQNISIDLIYGIPTLSDDNWKKNLETSFLIEVPHISAYGLTVENNTALETLIRKGNAIPLDENLIAVQFKILMNEMSANDFIHYEISNFCKDGFMSKHNSNYWKGIKYIGLGPSAHSYDQKSRQWNTSDISLYLNDIEKGKIPAEKEILNITDKYNEYVMTSMRTSWGCNLAYIKNTFGELYLEKFLSGIQTHMQSGFAANIKENIVLTDNGKLFADGIASDIFV